MSIYTKHIENLRANLIAAIREKLIRAGITEIELDNEDDDPIYIIWYNCDGDPLEVEVQKIEINPVFPGTLTIISAEKYSGETVRTDEHTMAGRNIEWLNDILDKITRQLETDETDSIQGMV